MKEKLTDYLSEVMTGLGISVENLKVDYPENPEHGDFFTNAALMSAKKLGLPAQEVAANIATEFKNNPPDFIENVSVAGPGFVNFKLKDRLFTEEAVSISKKEKDYGRTDSLGGKKIMVEYTDPNPFKVLHIGHLMSNAIGESISRLLEMSGAEIKRANWQGDVGPHVAKALWGSRQIEAVKGEKPEVYWGRAYVKGNEAYEADPASKKEIEEINKKIYDRSDKDINVLYDKGRAECLLAFESVYKRLGTKFDHYFFEGKEGRNGEAIVQEFLDKGIFEKSEGAVIFKGEKYGLHTRVFLTSLGLPTYETKELGLNKEKFKIYPDLSQSIIITANEQSDYFKVLLNVMDLIYPEIGRKTKHISHGMLRFASGKMSSRKGNVIAAESLIDEIKAQVKEKIAQRGFDEVETDEVSDMVAIGAIKYTILRQAIGGDVIFDSAASISFEGDSGPYLQYAAVRAHSILDKAVVEGISDNEGLILPEKAGLVERLLSRFPDIVARAGREYSPQLVSGYLINLAGAFNSLYASRIIIDKNDKLSPYYVILTKAFLITLTNGLWVLGIKVPKRM